MMAKAFPNGCRRDCQCGMVLVIVLWIITLLAVMAGSFAFSMRVETRLANSTVARAQARALAEAGIAYAQAWQLDHEANRTLWPPNGDGHDWSFGGRQLRIQTSNDAGLINLNSADDVLLKLLFAGIGLDETSQERLAKAVLQWRQPDRSSMAETVGLRGLSARLFESVEQLQQIEGITPDIYRRIADKVTVYSSHSGVNPELASAGLLQALGLDERTVVDYIAARAHAAAEATPPPTPPPQREGDAIYSGGRSNIYHIRVEVETGTGVVAVTAVTQLQSVGSGIGWQVLAWREGY